MTTIRFEELFIIVILGKSNIRAVLNILIFSAGANHIEVVLLAFPQRLAPMYSDGNLMQWSDMLSWLNSSPRGGICEFTHLQVGLCVESLISCSVRSGGGKKGLLKGIVQPKHLNSSIYNSEPTFFIQWSTKGDVRDWQAQSPFVFITYESE